LTRLGTKAVLRTPLLAWQSAEGKKWRAMKPGEPSQTAAMVTLLRAFGNAGISHVPDFRDPTARRLLPPAWSRRFLRAEARLRRAPSTLLDVTRHGADMMVLRTAKWLSLSDQDRQVPRAHPMPPR
jgi:hypothetical protein